MYENLTLRARRPLTPERIDAYVGTDCRLLTEDREGYLPFVITSATPTDDPHVAAITVQPKRVWTF